MYVQYVQLIEVFCVCFYVFRRNDEAWQWPSEKWMESMAIPEATALDNSKHAAKFGSVSIPHKHTHKHTHTYHLYYIIRIYIYIYNICNYVYNYVYSYI